MLIAIITIFILAYFYTANLISYRFMKNRILKKKIWDLNICCGKTDGGGLNVDIIKHADIPNFVQINDVINLPFRDLEFDHVLSSHTIEHVDDPEAFFIELQRIGAGNS